MERISMTDKPTVTDAMREAGARVFAKAAWQIPRAKPEAAAESIYTAMHQASDTGDDDALVEKLRRSLDSLRDSQRDADEDTVVVSLPALCDAILIAHEAADRLQAKAHEGDE
jgi:hypothetical protein